MKKLILLLALVTVAVLFGLSVWGSMRAEHAYRQLVLRVTESPDLRVLETSYQRGWLQSRSLADIEVRGALGESFQQWLVARGREEVRGRVGIRLRNTIEHGYAPLLDWLNAGLEGAPIVARIETQLELDKETQSEISAVLGLMPPATVSTLVRTTGVAESRLTIPAQRIASRLGEEEGGGWALVWKGLRGNAVYTTDFRHVIANLHSDGFEGGNSVSGVALQDLTWNADLTRDASGLLVGEAHTRIGALRLVSVAEESPGIEFDHWVMSQTSAVESGRFSSSMRAHFKAVRFGDPVYGPGEIELALHNLDAATLARLQNDGLFDPASSGSEAVQQIAAELEPVQPRWLDLLSRSPQLELRALRLATPSGDVEARARIAIDGGRPELFRNPITLPLAFAAQLEFVCPVDVLENFYRSRTDRLQALRQDGWVLLEGDRYRSSWQLERGSLTVNGVPKTLGDLIGNPRIPTELSQLEADGSGSEPVAARSELLP